MLKNNYIHFILSGCVIWIIGFFFATATLYPWAYIFIFIGPTLLFIGILAWFKYRIAIEYNEYKLILAQTKGFLRYQNSFQNYLKQNKQYFFVGLIILWIVSAFVITQHYKTSNSFKMTKEYINKMTEIKNEIGDIKYYGFLTGGTLSPNGNANLTFSIIGENKTVSAESVVINNKVIEVTFY